MAELRMCSWCHHHNPAGAVYCACCEHRADRPRCECDCGYCTGPHPEIDLSPLLEQVRACGPGEGLRGLIARLEGNDR